MQVDRFLKYSLRWGGLKCADGGSLGFDLSAPIAEV